MYTGLFQITLLFRCTIDYSRCSDISGFAANNDNSIAYARVVKCVCRNGKLSPRGRHRRDVFPPVMTSALIRTRIQFIMPCTSVQGGVFNAPHCHAGAKRRKVPRYISRSWCERLARRRQEEGCRFRSGAKLVRELGRGTCYAIVKACKTAPATSPTLRYMPHLRRRDLGSLGLVLARISSPNILYLNVLTDLDNESSITTMKRLSVKSSAFENLCLNCD